MRIEWERIDFDPRRLPELGLPPFPDATPVEGHRVSVVVTCHNYGRYLRECLDSILSQTVRPFEVLLVDDASDDDTPTIAAEYVPDVRYIRTEHRDPHLARRDGFRASTAEFLLFVDADNHLPVNYIASGLACFDSPNVAVVYSDLERFGAETGRVMFPSRFDDHLFAQQNFVDTNSLIRRSALDVANPWDRGGLAPMPEDYYMFRKLRDAGFEFRKQRSAVKYRVHRSQRSWTKCSARDADYYAAMGLQYQTVTLFLPLSGRLDCWRQMSTFIASQSWPHDQIRLICCDTSQDPGYAREIRQWLLDSDYSDVTYFALAAGTAGLVNQDRRNAAVETETNLVMCRIYNELRRRLTTDFAWVLEDDVIPRRPDQLERMLRCFHADVATVSAPYLSRYDPDYVAWRKDAAGKNYRIKRGTGVEQIAGSGFGCLVMRRGVLDSYVFRIPTSERWYDPVFFDTAVAPRGRSLIDWDLECEHVGVRRGATEPMNSGRPLCPAVCCSALFALLA